MLIVAAERPRPGPDVLDHHMASIGESKLPPLAAAFWVMKISATTLGETAGDLLSMTLTLRRIGR